MKRHAIQITDLNDTIVALCNDGSIWFLDIGFDDSITQRKWRRVPDIPNFGKSQRQTDVDSLSDNAR